MSAQELQTLANQFVDAFNKKDLATAANMLSNDLEVFDHVPYRFDNKEQFVNFLGGAIGGLETINWGLRQSSARVFGDTGVVNAYDTFTGVMKGGKVQTLHGRTTLMFAKQGGQWKIVSAHFSPLPQHAG